MLMSAVEQLLAGDRVGQVPPGTNVPPIVDDFRKLAQRYKLPTETIHTRELQLDLYRKHQSREISRLLHQLNSLGITFAQFVAGPDFQRGVDLERMIEIWQVRWTPSTEAGLIEAAVYGSSIAEAADHRLREQIMELSAHPGEHSTSDAVELLISSCCMGLHSLGSQLLTVLRQVISADPQLPSLAGGLTQLVLLHESREPLEASRLSGLPSLITACFQRACQLTRDAGRCPDNVVDEWLAALAPLRELMTIPLTAADATSSLDNSQKPSLDPDLWHQALQHILSQPPDKTHSIMAGAAAGILFSAGQLSQQDLIKLVQGHLEGTHPSGADACGMLRGLLTMSRDVAWNVPEILSAMNDLLSRWDETAFLQVLPDLRLAFADLTPQETYRVAESVASLHVAAHADELMRINVPENEVQTGIELSHRVRESLMRDKLISKDTPSQ